MSGISARWASPRCSVRTPRPPRPPGSWDRGSPSSAASAPSSRHLVHRAATAVKPATTAPPRSGGAESLRTAVLDATPEWPAPFIGVWRRVPSTNEVAKTAALDAGAVPLAGTVVIAETQTQGKGRFGRTWVSPPGGLYLSVLVEPPARPGERSADPLTLLPLAAGVAVARAVRRVAAVPAELRWPNDLDWEGRKVAGVLTEVGFRKESPRLAVVGFGVNLTPVSLPGAVTADASGSLLPPGARPPGRLPEGVDRAGLAGALVTSLHGALDLLRENPASLRTGWESLSPTARGCRCEVRLRAAAPVFGITDGLDAGGGLRIRTDGGGIRVVTESDAVRILHTGHRRGRPARTASE
ncbi:MAG: biotin--[acetyl-CoA-carboxylase] ligase [Acidobacteria bacterium]|nr:biotin--[acetyl-CoA-carboxylase] ligase [Acidobacteriota bacterium]MYE42586.1 biotin--[acetyl-CoA-carboxylase] ligase [Acidobacteriota bacterium]